MRRIGTPNSLFNAGDPATNTKGTVVTADWLNAIQEELAAVVEGLGGTINPADGNQVFDWILASFAAITGNASQLFRAATPGQFDASSYVATMAAVQRALGNRQGVLEISASVALTAADVGKTVIFYGSGATATLPALSAIPLGSEVEAFGLSNSNNTVAAAGTDVIYVNNNTVTSLAIGQGGSARLVKRTGGWALVGGTVNCRNAQAEFGSSLGNNGYQKLPSGLIIQWVQVAASATPGNPVAVTWPITFPSAIYGTVSTIINDIGTTIRSSWLDSIGLAGGNVHASVTGVGVSIYAVGK